MDTNIIMLIIVAVTIVLVVVLWQGMSVAKTQMFADQKTEYHKLAEQASAAEQKSADAQQKTAEALEDIRARLVSIEKLLREVQ